jgi:hypothetical protein
MAAGGPTQLITSLSTIKTAPKWSFSGRKDDDKGKLQTPGPGAYSSQSPDVGKYMKSPRVVFGTSGREALNKSNVPGPGQYVPTDNPLHSPRFGFGTAKRDGMQSKANTPGPGAYSVPTVVGVEGSKYSVTGRREDKLVTMMTPGPGTYQPNDTQRAGNEKPPTWSFGTSPRQSMVSSRQTPGPGQYEAQSRMGGPAFSIKARRDVADRHNITPGPGAHGGLYTQFGY